jgi:hypothetical protein
MRDRECGVGLLKAVDLIVTPRFEVCDRADIPSTRPWGLSRGRRIFQHCPIEFLLFLQSPFLVE